MVRSGWASRLMIRTLQTCYTHAVSLLGSSVLKGIAIPLSAT
jgi:hypothetical protein